MLQIIGYGVIETAVRPYPESSSIDDMTTPVAAKVETIERYGTEVLLSQILHRSVLRNGRVCYKTFLRHQNPVMQAILVWQHIVKAGTQRLHEREECVSKAGLLMP